MINVVYADAAAENTEAVSEMVQEAEEKKSGFSNNMRQNCWTGVCQKQAVSL